MDSPQREAYQLPNTQPPASSGYTPSYGGLPEEDLLSVTYLCAECQCKVALKKGDAIRCKDCGHRVLYKMRTKRMVQFEAR